MTSYDAVFAEATTSLQDELFPDGVCFGCGPANAGGLRLRSFATPEGPIVARFRPWPEHDNGLGLLNGGIIATVLDCHSGAVAFTEARRQGWPALAGADFPHVTAGLDLRYRRPAPLTDEVTLVGEVASSSEPEIVVEVRLEYDGKVRADATALWKRWRPRP